MIFEDWYLKPEKASMYLIKETTKFFYIDETLFLIIDFFKTKFNEIYIWNDKIDFKNSQTSLLKSK
jgi:hypothetical protein